MSFPPVSSPAATQAEAPSRDLECVTGGVRKSWLQNVLIGLFLLLMLIQAVPAVPPRIAGIVRPMALWVGVEQDQWQMFAPNPDRRNHRISARVVYSDGTSREWRPPAWREQSRWERFLTHRLSKYCENIYNPGFVAARPTAAKWIAAELARDVQSPSATPERVEFWAEEGDIPDPHYFPWSSMAEATEFTSRWQFDEVPLEPAPGADLDQVQP